MTSMLPAWEDRLMGSVQVWARGFASYESRCEWFLLCIVLFLNPRYARLAPSWIGVW